MLDGDAEAVHELLLALHHLTLALATNNPTFSTRLDRDLPRGWRESYSPVEALECMERGQALISEVDGWFYRRDAEHVGRIVANLRARAVTGEGWAVRYARDKLGHFLALSRVLARNHPRKSVVAGIGSAVRRGGLRLAVPSGCGPRVQAALAMVGSTADGRSWEELNADRVTRDRLMLLAADQPAITLKRMRPRRAPGISATPLANRAATEPVVPKAAVAEFAMVLIDRASAPARRADVRDAIFSRLMRDPRWGSTRGQRDEYALFIAELED